MSCVLSTGVRRQLTATVLLALVGLLGGCSRLRTGYGDSKGRMARTSLNGFAALRRSYENAGFRTRDVSRLSNRVMQSDTIVWTPKVLGAIDARVTRWFERWLSLGDRTLVYIIPDSGSEVDYWTDVSRLAPPAQRLEYRKRAARSINERMMWRLNREPVASNGWFRIQPTDDHARPARLEGPWADDLGQLRPEDNLSLEFEVEPYDPDAKNPAQAAGGGTFTQGATGPGSPGWTLATTTTATKTEIEFSPLVETADGTCVIGEVRSENWKGSRILVVAGGSLLTNYALAQPVSQRLTTNIIRRSTPPGPEEPVAGFLASDWNPIAVSDKQPGVPQATGMELLTVWPISLVTMHGVMLGLVICLMLLPIFGRPRKVVRAAENDFGHHLDAVASLMNKSGGERYARARISDYMKRMHGETSGPWVIPDPPTSKNSPLVAKRLRPHGSTKPAASPSQTPADPQPPRATPSTSPESVDDPKAPEKDEADR